MSGWSAKVEARRGEFHLDVSVASAGGVLALIGPNGSGKTTLLRALAGAITLDRAEIEWAGRVIEDTTRGLREPMERRRVGYVPQRHCLFPHMSVVDNVAFGLSLGPQQVPLRAREARAIELLDELGCGALVDRSVRTLSGGESQRVAMARALALEPELLLLDEPLAALDAVTRREVRRVFAARLEVFDRPAVIVTHDVRDVVALGAQVCALERGRVVQRGTLEEVRAEPATAFVEAFLGELG